MSERDEFERWAIAKYGVDLSLPLFNDKGVNQGEYRNQAMREAWPVWQARADLAAERGRELVEVLGRVIDDGLCYQLVESDPCVEDARELIAKARDGQGGGDEPSHPTYGTLDAFLAEIREHVTEGSTMRMGQVGAINWFAQQYNNQQEPDDEQK